MRDLKPTSLSVSGSTPIMREIKPSVKTNCKRKINAVVSTIPQKKVTQIEESFFFVNLTIDRVKLIKCEYISHTTERLVKKQIRMQELL